MLNFYEPIKNFDFATKPSCLNLYTFKEVFVLEKSRSLDYKIIGTLPNLNARNIHIVPKYELLFICLGENYPCSQI